MSLKETNKIETNRYQLEIVIDGEKFREAIKEAYRKNGKKINVPGFRKGKAPLHIIETYYGAEVFYEDALNLLYSDVVEEAINASGLKVIDDKMDFDLVSISKEDGVDFKVSVTTYPEIELTEYKGLKAERPLVKVDAAEVNAEIKAMAERNARMVSVEDRAAKKGDTVVIDFEGFVDGVAFDGGKAEGHSLELGSGQFIPGFEDQIIGKNINDEFDINVTFPEEYGAKELAGKPAVFKIKLHEIKVRELPAVDDEFAKDVSEFDTLKELEASIKERLEKDNAQKAKYETEEAAIKAVCDKSKVEIPSGMVDMEVDHMIQDINQRLSYQGLKLEQYLKMIGKTEEEVRKEYEPQAIEAIKSRLTLEAVRKAEKIEATDEEINAKLEEMAKNYGKKVEEINDNENLKDYIKEGIESEKAIDFIVKNAKIK